MLNQLRATLPDLAYTAFVIAILFRRSLKFLEVNGYMWLIAGMVTLAASLEQEVAAEDGESKNAPVVMTNGPWQAHAA